MAQYRITNKFYGDSEIVELRKSGKRYYFKDGRSLNSNWRVSPVKKPNVKIFLHAAKLIDERFRTKQSDIGCCYALRGYKGNTPELLALKKIMAPPGLTSSTYWWRDNGIYFNKHTTNARILALLFMIEMIKTDSI